MSKVCYNSKCKYTNSDASHYCVMCGEPLEKTWLSTKPDKKYVVIAESELKSLKSSVTSLEFRDALLRRDRDALQQRIDKLWGVRLKKWYEKNDEWIWNTLIIVIAALFWMGCIVWACHH